MSRYTFTGLFWPILWHRAWAYSPHNVSITHTWNIQTVEFYNTTQYCNSPKTGIFNKNWPASGGTRRAHYIYMYVWMLLQYWPECHFVGSSRSHRWWQYLQQSNWSPALLPWCTVGTQTCLNLKREARLEREVGLGNHYDCLCSLTWLRESINSFLAQSTTYLAIYSFIKIPIARTRAHTHDLHSCEERESRIGEEYTYPFIRR